MTAQVQKRGSSDARRAFSTADAGPMQLLSGGCDGSHFHLDVLKNILSFTRDASLLRGQHSCFLSSLCRFEKSSRAQRVLMPGRISDGAGRLSASQLSLHEPQKPSSKHRWCGFNWLQLSRSLFTK